jgi:hypothetical protein
MSSFHHPCCPFVIPIIRLLFFPSFTIPPSILVVPKVTQQELALPNLFAMFLHLAQSDFGVVTLVARC